MKILITGSDGQLGRSVVAALGEHRVEAAGHKRLDITDLAAVREAIKRMTPDIVVNAAAFTGVDAAETDRTQSFPVNVVGPRNLALATSAAAIPLVHFSTDYVFDGTSSRPYREDDDPRPISAYGADKLAGEEAVREQNPRHYIVRTAWLFHPSGRNFLNTIRALGERRQIRVIYDQAGSPTYAPHLAAAVAALIETQAYGTYHLAGQGGTSRFDLIRLLFSMLNLKTAVLPAQHTEFPVPARRPAYSVLTTIKQPPIMLPPWQEGVATFVRALS